MKINTLRFFRTRGFLSRSRQHAQPNVYRRVAAMCGDWKIYRFLCDEKYVLIK